MGSKSPSKSMQKAMRIVWEGESKHNKWEDLWEYPYSDGQRKEIYARLELTVKTLFEKFPEGVK